MKKISMGRVMLLLLTLIISRNSFGQHHVQGNWGNTYLYFDDDSSSVPPKTIVVYRNENGPLYTLHMAGDKVLDLTVDGRAVSSDSINGSYKAVIQEIKGQVERARVQARLDRLQAERDREQAGRDREQAEQRRDVNRQRGTGGRAGRDQEQAERDRQQAGRDREQAERDREQAERDRKRAAEDRAIMQSIMDDLVKDGLVPDKESVHSLKINADEFLLNGKSLPEAVQKKYIAKYVTGKGYSMSYHNED
jgi:colicin import membrane protein